MNYTEYTSLLDLIDELETNYSDTEIEYTNSEGEVIA